MMWNALLSNGTEWINDGKDDCWRRLLYHCKKNNIKIKTLFAGRGIINNNVSHYFILRESTIFFAPHHKIMITKIGIGTIRDWIHKAYIDWYDEKTHNKLYRQVISSQQLETDYKFLPEISIPAEKLS